MPGSPTIEQRGPITCIGDKVRLETGKKRVTAIATEELLHDDRTARKYWVGDRPEPKYKDGQLVRDRDGKPVMVATPGRDSLGELIVLGQPMTYIELGGETHAPVLAHYLYVWQPRTPEDLELNKESRMRCAAAIAEEADPDRKASYQEDLDGMLNYWAAAGQFDDRDAALAAGVALAGEQA